MFSLSIFLTTLVFPIVTAPQVNFPSSWYPPVADSWQLPTVRFVEQVQAKGIKGIKEETNACLLNYCTSLSQPELPLELLEKVPETGFFVLVDVSENREYVFQDKKLLMENLVSTGSSTRFKSNCYTPIGEWRIIEKIKTAADSEFGPYFLRLAKWNGEKFAPTPLALHGTNEPELLGKPASHGCIRHENRIISHLAQILPIGTIIETIE
ncbi:MAG: L,D-transpeptidase [Candidatus Cloacimonetes bacterium]|nr:L,D-transpeptidase [Candidatus Cloacimonadota bacterium]